MAKAQSEKKDKQEANRKYRRKIKQKVKNKEENPPILREESNLYAFGKDGKNYDIEMKDKELRKTLDFETIMNTVGIEDHSSYLCLECLKACPLNF